MNESLRRELADRVSAATPSSLPPFDGVRRRARRDRWRTAGASVAAAAVVLGVVAGSWSMWGSDPRSDGERLLGERSTAPTPRADPTYADSGFPSGLVARLPDGDVQLPADTSCWTEQENCRRGLMLHSGAGPDLGRQDAIDFWFARPGWTFTATVRQTGEVCPRATTVEATAISDHWFRIQPADAAGDYDVDLEGVGPDSGMVSTRFRWTTTSDGPIEDPSSSAYLFAEPGGDGAPMAEVVFDDLPFQPTAEDLSRALNVRATAEDGGVSTAQVPLVEPSLECGVRGSRGQFYYQSLLPSGAVDPVPGPLDLEVSLAIRGTTYVARGRWAGGRQQGYVPLTFTPPLPS